MVFFVGSVPRYDLTTLRKLHEVFYGRSAKAVERLVIIANHTDICVAGSESEEEALLDGVGILVFIDDHMLEDATRIGIAVENLQRLLLEQ